MSGRWNPVGDGIHEWQQETGAKSDGTLTVVVRSIGQSTKYPHASFNYNPDTGEFTYSHYSFTGSRRSGMQEVVQTAIAYLKKVGAL